MARRNVALASNGGVASGSSTTSSVLYPYAGCIDGNRTSSGWGGNPGSGWASASPPPQWWQVDFSAPMLIDEVDVITYGSATEPTLTTTDNVSSFGAKNYTVDYWDGSAWQTVITVTNNLYVWRQFTGLNFTTTKMRVNISLAYDGTARLLEVEAWGDTPSKDLTGGFASPAPSFALSGNIGISGSITEAVSAETIDASGNVVQQVVTSAPPGSIGVIHRCWRTH